MAAETRPGWEETAGGEERGRSQSSSPTSTEPKRTRNGSSSNNHRLKAAAAARLNRQRKKQYVLGLESRLQGLAAENRQLRDRNRGLCRRLRDLEQEASYLRAVLANQSAVGRLLSRLAGDGRVGLRISSSLFEDRESRRENSSTNSSSSSNNGDHDYALPVPEEEEEEEEGHKRAAALSSSNSPPPGNSSGICLHVDRDQVSVEFCSVCARRAAAGSALAAVAASSSSSSFISKIFSFRCLPCQAPLCRG